MEEADLETFKDRRADQNSRPGDTRSEFARDRARVVHSAGFRRLQGKTQVMGVGEGDFHRTRLTHSIECAQIANGIRLTLESNLPDAGARIWLPDRDLLEAACFAHDLGHPPFGHGGEVALHRKMHTCGGFEGNGQTLRLICRLEKYREPIDGSSVGIDPTRRLVLAVLKYPLAYDQFNLADHKTKPPKCYFDLENDVVDWAMDPFAPNDRDRLRERNDEGKTIRKTFDCTIMELADDIAYGVHDIEDIVGRGLVRSEEMRGAVGRAFEGLEGPVLYGDSNLTADYVSNKLLGPSGERKQMVSDLVNLFVSSVTVTNDSKTEHPLLTHRAALPDHLAKLLKGLKAIAHDLVVSNAKARQLELRGQRIVSRLIDELLLDPEGLIPAGSWDDLQAVNGCDQRRVCDYVAGMTDRYAEKVYHRLFTPGYGSSADEI